MRSPPRTSSPSSWARKSSRAARSSSPTRSACATSTSEARGPRVAGGASSRSLRSIKVGARAPIARCGGRVCWPEGETFMDRIWLASYPAGIPADIDADQFASVPALLEHITAKFADRPAYRNLGHTMSYAALERRSRAFGAFLQGLPGMAAGDRVAIMAPNLLQYPVAL